MSQSQARQLLQTAYDQDQQGTPPASADVPALKQAADTLPAVNSFKLGHEHDSTLIQWADQLPKTGTARIAELLSRFGANDRTSQNH